MARHALLAWTVCSRALRTRDTWDSPSFGLAAADEIHGGVYIATDYVSTTAAPHDSPPRVATNSYPASGSPYFKNAADLVEVRVQPLATGIAFGVRFNTLVDPAVPVAAIGSTTAAHRCSAAPWPFGAGSPRRARATCSRSTATERDALPI
jgi:hypothetical protein